jgi:dTDP-4-dehydrorhamnose 3,5-epimerase-like enzyme
MLESRGGKPVVQTATLVRDETVVIPPFVAHGFLAVKPLELLYLVTNEYDASDELGFFWNDPTLALDWPSDGTRSGNVTLSDRDLSNPPLRDLVSILRRNRQV